MTQDFIILSPLRKSSRIKIKDIKKGTKFVYQITKAVWIFDGYDMDFNVHLIRESDKKEKWLNSSSFRIHYRILKARKE